MQKKKCRMFQREKKKRDISSNIFSSLVWAFTFFSDSLKYFWALFYNKSLIKGGNCLDCWICFWWSAHFSDISLLRNLTCLTSVLTWSESVVITVALLFIKKQHHFGSYIYSTAVCFFIITECFVGI